MTPGDLKSEWPVIDLRRCTSRGRRGRYCGRGRFEGPIDDLEEVRIVYLPAGHDPNQWQWVVEWIWRNELHRAVSRAILGAFKIFSFVATVDVWRSSENLRTLTGMARCTGLPPAVLRAYLDQLGVFDLSAIFAMS